MLDEQRSESRNYIPGKQVFFFVLDARMRTGLAVIHPLDNVKFMDSLIKNSEWS